MKLSPFTQVQKLSNVWNFCEFFFCWRYFHEPSRLAGAVNATRGKSELHRFVCQNQHCTHLSLYLNIFRQNLKAKQFSNTGGDCIKNTVHRTFHLRPSVDTFWPRENPKNGLSQKIQHFSRKNTRIFQFYNTFQYNTFQWYNNFSIKSKGFS